MNAKSPMPPATLVRIPNANTKDWNEITQLVILERYYRDNAMWDAQAACYAAEGRVTTSWFNGNAHDFVGASRKMYETAGPERIRAIHQMHPKTIRVSGDRAVVESYGAIEVRQMLKGVLVDLVSTCRFFSRLCRQEGDWRISTFDGIFMKDKIEAVHPGNVLTINWADVENLRSSYRYLCYVGHTLGYSIHSQHLGADEPEQLDQFYGEALTWLEESAA